MKGPSPNEQRRSPRSLWRIPFIAIWTPGKTLTVREQGETEVVNAHGALIKLSTRLRLGDEITLSRPGRSLTKLARVVSDQGLGPDGKARLGVELDTPSLEFWAELAR
ncbi:MAG: hypothetical protein HY653_04910 [Acidobacteria bacterium]|nr:hypothetical protein [Acidobacteriota bacterium]